MEISHGSPPTGTCHTEFSVENNCIYLYMRPFIYQMADRRGQTKGKRDKATQSKTTR